MKDNECCRIVTFVRCLFVGSSPRCSVEHAFLQASIVTYNWIISLRKCRNQVLQHARRHGALAYSTLWSQNYSYEMTVRSPSKGQLYSAEHCIMAVYTQKGLRSLLRSVSSHRVKDDGQQTRGLQPRPDTTRFFRDHCSRCMWVHRAKGVIRVVACQTRNNITTTH